MINPPKTPLQASLHCYGLPADWRSYNAERCAYEVSTSVRWPSFHQCLRKPGHGAGGLYCKQHAKRVPA